MRACQREERERERERKLSLCNMKRAFAPRHYITIEFYPNPLDGFNPSLLSPSHQHASMIHGKGIISRDAATPAVNLSSFSFFPRAFPSSSNSPQPYFLFHPHFISVIQHLENEIRIWLKIMKRSSIRRMMISYLVCSNRLAIYLWILKDKVSEKTSQQTPSWWWNDAFFSQIWSLKIRIKEWRRKKYTYFKVQINRIKILT